MRKDAMRRHPESSNPKDPSTGVTRREFAQTAALAGVGFMIVPRHVLGRGLTPPSDLVNIATVGVSGMGGSNTEALMSQNIVAICDCDFALLDDRLKKWRDAAAAPPPAPAPAQTGGGQGRQ